MTEDERKGVNERLDSRELSPGTRAAVRLLQAAADFMNGEQRNWVGGMIIAADRFAKELEAIRQSLTADPRLTMELDPPSDVSLEPADRTAGPIERVVLVDHSVSGLVTLRVYSRNGATLELLHKRYCGATFQEIAAAIALACVEYEATPLIEVGGDGQRILDHALELIWKEKPTK
jgi:hypothetical protein